MERLKWLGVVGLAGSAVLLARLLPTTFVSEEPVLTTIIALCSSAIVLLILCRLLQERRLLGHGHSDSGFSDETHHHHHVHDSRFSWLSQALARLPQGVRQARSLLFISILAITIRAFIFRQLLIHPQCIPCSWEPLLPCALALWQIWTTQPKRDEPKVQITQAQYMYFAATFLFGVGSIGVTFASRGPRSTYICGTVWRYRILVPSLHYLGTLLDLILVCCVHKLVEPLKAGQTQGSIKRLVPAAWAALISATLISVIEFVYTSIETFVYWVSNWHRDYSLIPSWLYFQDAVIFNMLICLLVACAALTICHFGTMPTLLIFGLCSLFTATSDFTQPYTYSALSRELELLATCFTALGFLISFRIALSSRERANGKPLRPTSKATQLLGYISMAGLVTIMLFFMRTTTWADRETKYVSRHPIDTLISNAQTAHENYVQQASSSRDLEEAVITYRLKYGRQPPPNFQHWYNFATARNSSIIDTYDSIHRDLTPFYALTPKEIRQRTVQMIRTPENDIAGISIRNGTPSIDPNTPGTHRWMLDGVVAMVSHFAEWLPDMDLAFNLSDECRIIVPYDAIEKYRQAGSSSGDYSSANTPQNAFSPDRSETWDSTLNHVSNPATVFKNAALEHIFHSYASLACSPDSAARTQRLWDTSTHCTSCSAPHSHGLYLSNWTSAADICHQPDLAHLHGFYLSPSTFKTSQQLLPVFSQSKAHGFVDILYPSPWNYMDKVKYEPNDEFPDRPFAEKNGTLFWRGETTEGISSGRGQWQGMARQRFVHLANSHASMSGASFPLLLSSSSDSSAQDLSYTPLPLPTLHHHFPSTLQIVNNITRCDGQDCDDQTPEFVSRSNTRVDFQGHWNYKYLLDLDGAGLSGRFLPFLHSHSLPFKAALFREWWDERLTAWQHFVPLDLRGHGLWGTLGYFQGFEGEVAGVAGVGVNGRRVVRAEPHEREAERVAENGRVWAEKVLRKEDMEIYMFRLLLEWGRLTDDGRDGIGYS